MCFEPEDQYGIYTVSVVVKDKIDETVEKIEEKINLVKFENREYFHEDQEFLDWVYKYHVEPLPEKAIDAFLYSIKSQFIENKNSLEPYLCYFIEIFNENKFLIPHFLEMFETLDRKSKYYIILLFTNLDYDFNDFFSSLNDDEQDLYKKILQQNINFNPYSDNPNFHTMDMLWGTFFGSGKFKPIYRIAEMLQFKEYYKYYEKLEKGEKVKEKERQKAFLGMLFIQAHISLQSNCRNHKLVLNYCTYILENEIKSKSMKLEIMDVLMSFSHVQMDYKM